MIMPTCTISRTASMMTNTNATGASRRSAASTDGATYPGQFRVKITTLATICLDPHIPRLARFIYARHNM
jgi:hypothetical protein